MGLRATSLIKVGGASGTVQMEEVWNERGTGVHKEGVAVRNTSGKGYAVTPKSDRHIFNNLTCCGG